MYNFTSNNTVDPVLVNHYLFEDGVHSNLDAIVKQTTLELTAVGKQMADNKQILKKTPPKCTNKWQPCDVSVGHSEFDKVYKGPAFVSANIEGLYASKMTSNLLRDACATVRGLNFPKTSLDVLLRVILLSPKIDTCFSSEKIKKGFELAHYPNVDVVKILEQNIGYNMLPVDKQAKVVSLVLGEFTAAFDKDDEMSDKTVLDAFKREDIQVSASFMIPLRNEEKKPVNQIRACNPASDVLREKRRERMQANKDKAEKDDLAIKSAQAKKRKETEDEQLVVESNKKLKAEKNEERKALAGKCSNCMAKKKNVDDWVWTNCANYGPRKCHTYVCPKSTCQGVLHLHQPSCAM